MDNRRGGTSGLQERRGQLFLVYLRVRRQMLRRAIRAYKHAGANLGEFQAMSRSASKAARDALKEAGSNKTLPFPAPPLRAFARRIPWLDPDKYLDDVDQT
jgi:hypothetical protein